ncbi:malto-oligosyltrehalose synthase [Microvirga guangxiensis]|uniref:4-alpha-glucanotransferase n=1 Tax=Microvirga guangxiensis TaxID=549386 RepID=A0A1G5I9Y5_9HYPH|nr:malto-oligosyltrehalose synthase [Microvirga guangxiensis]SCY72561.1 maltooligosyl trehalose synthase [Microvirga guangxiensis]
MSKLDALLERMAGLVGISPNYADAFGRRIETSEETRNAILAALGLGTGSEAEAQQSLARLEKLKSSPLPSVITALSGSLSAIPLQGELGPAQWRITEEDGTQHEGMLTKGETALQLPALPMGYHLLQVGDLEATLIASPESCWQPEAFRDDKRFWGAVAQVYSLRSEQDLGIGDYSDVARLAEGVGGRGGSFLGLSPVHALFAADRTKISPYSPSSRLFLEAPFIDPTVVEGFIESGAKQILEKPDVQKRLIHLQNAQFIDYHEVWAIKRLLLDTLWSHVQQTIKHPEFETFRKAGGQALEAHATFEALSEHFREQGCNWIGDWPEEYQDIRSSEVERFRSTHAERIEFHLWLQWLADRQLAEAAKRARAAGLSIGLYRDLAVGADGGGSEIWATPERFAPRLAIGAPPDPLGPQGQNWGLPPFNPLTLEEQGLAAFRDLVAANMRHAGAIRIDHAFQLQRLFLIPSGAAASQGAYVDYPFEAMLAVLRVESHRAQCLVIAEDLGTAPEGFSDAIMASGVLSYRVLPFEREGSDFRKPNDYPRSALSVLTTHDLPTFKGWWRGLDIDLRQTLGVFDPEAASDEREKRQIDKESFARALTEEGLLSSADLPIEPPLEGTVRYLARTSCVLMALQIEDASGELNQPNMPGMDDGHPNWRRRLSNTIESIVSSNSLLSKLSTALAEERRDAHSRTNILASAPPRATYRLQFHKDFTFDDAAKIVPYLAKLGISHVYSSPIHTATPGSTHGYDITDHSAINPELGGEEGFRRLSDTLAEHGLKLLLDIVPNHMGVGGESNGWWLSVLEWGKLSPVADAFDIDWERPGARGKLILPVLGSTYGEALENGELQLKFDADEGSFSVWHWEHRLPICPSTYPLVLDSVLAIFNGGAKTTELLTLTERLRTLAEPASDAHLSWPEEGDRLKRRLKEMAAAHPAVRRAIDAALASLNGTQGVPDSFNALHRLLEAQAYRLTYWRAASSDINYRRFFDINNLAGMRVEIPEVFARTHKLITQLVKDNRVHGLRIDHIDGLADPEGYTRALQRQVGPGFYVVVEKILEPEEQLRPWPVAGTSGYDVLNLIDGVLTNHAAEEAFERIYREASNISDDYDKLLKRAKFDIIRVNFASELEALVLDIKAIADANRHTRDYTTYALRQALVEIIAAFPVYRSYITDREAAPADVQLIEDTIKTAKQTSALPDHKTHDFVEAVLLGKSAIADFTNTRQFKRRFQQLTGPVMAKSLEDTTFYRYGRMIALNEVGGDPGHFGLTLQDFHEANAQRARDWPYSMIATATHDTKRGEDARARLLALSEMPEEWEGILRLWRETVSPHLSEVGGTLAPDANDQVILLQALLGAWPLELLEADDDAQLKNFHERMKGFVTKALREAKRQTSWISPNAAYEEAAQNLLQAVLSPKSSILDRLRPFARRLAVLGMLNGLSRTVLKMTLPGVPDIYQGTEFWDFSLVDPDNRRPVDYALRAQSLDGEPDLEALLTHWHDGRIKQQILTALMRDRAETPGLYAEGDYQVIQVEGERASQVVAFFRGHGDEKLAVIVPRLWTSLPSAEQLQFNQTAWLGMSVSLPEGHWRNVITGSSIQSGGDGHPLSAILSPFPFAVLKQA